MGELYSNLYFEKPDFQRNLIGYRKKKNGGKYSVFLGKQAVAVTESFSDLILTSSCAMPSCSVLSLCDPMNCVARQASLSMEFSRQEYWSGLSCPPSGDLPNPGIKPRSPTLHTDSLPFEAPGSPDAKTFFFSVYLKSISVACAFQTELHILAS